MRYWPFLVLFALLFGCLEVETGSVDKWTPAGDVFTPTLQATPTPTIVASPTPGASPTIAPTPTLQPSPTPSPEPVECTVTASGQDVGALKKRVIVRFTQEVSGARVRCHSSRSWQSLTLEKMSGGQYQGFADCSYSSTGTYVASAEGGGAECEKEFVLAD